jgi:PEGA domain
MLLVTALLLAAAASGDPAGAEPSAKATDVGPMRTATLIDHTPLEKAARGLSVVIKARITNPSGLFAPQVYARPAGSKRYQGYSMSESKGGRFAAHLPANLLNDGSLEYFIEARNEDGSAARAGSPSQPFSTLAYDPPPVPVPSTFRTELDGAEVKIDGDSIGKTPITVALTPGPHQIIVTAPDGRSAEQQIEVRNGSKKLSLMIPLPEPGGEGSSMSVLSEPTGARVLLDGTVAGTTPFAGPVEPGVHVIAVEADGRLRQERQISAKQGRDVQLSFVLPAMPKDPALSIESEPVGALVSIDKKERGRTPYVGPLGAGPHQVVLALEGRRSVATDISMPKDRDMSLRLELPAGSGSSVPRLTISSQPPGAIITLDGVEVGPTPWSEEVKAGDRKVAVKLDGYKSDERKVPVATGRDADVSFALTRNPGPGKLHIETDPTEAVVSIDGQQVGTAPFNGDVAPGDHQLEVSLEKYRSVAQGISLEPGQSLSLKLAMQEATSERLPPLIAVASDPQGAQLAVDGKPAGVTPVKVRSVPGSHEIRLTLDGYTPRTGKILLPESKDFELRMAISLKPLRGTAVVQAAPEAIELARAQLKRAASCYRQGDYKCALASYQAAYEFKPVPELLYNIAQTRRRDGQYREAAEAYKAFIKEAPSSKMKNEAEKYLAFCELQVDPTRASTSIAAGPRVPGEATDATSGGALPTVAVSERGAGAVANDPTVEPPAVASDPTVEPPKPAAPVVTAAARSTEASSDFTKVEEDNEPPVITHTAVAKAIRGQTLRLTARIIDERSDVANPQACWKNLFKTDYQCAQLIKIGEDTFAVEVPAKAVTDGFSYYLEAYDTSENGPARAGAPELPNAVVIEEAPPPKPAAVAVADARDDRPSAPAEAVGLNPSGKPGGEPEVKSHVVSYIAIGSAVAAVAGGIGLNVHANSLINSLGDGSIRSSQEINSIKSQSQTEQTLGYVLFGVAGAFVVGAVAFWNAF